MIKDPNQNQDEQAIVNDWFELANVLDRLNRLYNVVEVPTPKKEKVKSDRHNNT